MPADGSSSVDCATQAVAPTAPVVYDNCGRLITVGTPTVQYDTACGGSVVYSFVYTGCDNQPKTWKYTYTVKPPTYTMPADGSSSVDCATQAVAPTAPVVYDNCGRLITVGTPTVQYDTACGGSVVYSFVYTGCDNQPKTWKYTYTVKPPTYTMPADGSSSVDCATQAVAPTAPVVYDNCGRLITVGTPTVQYDTACGGSVVYSFVYTGCDNQPKTWKYTYTVKPPTYTMPADGSSSVDCATQAVAPTAAVVYDNCGRLITVGTPTVQYDTACGGSVVYSFVYTGCDNQPKTWKYTYTVKPPTYTMPADGSSSVDCATQAVAPTAAVVYDNCGRLITVGTPTVQYDTACGGSVVYSFVYTGCDNQPKTWKYTYTVKPPTYTMPADGSSSVDCATQAVAPTAAVVYDNCGRLITVGTPTVQYDTACGGSVVYSFVYTGCDNQPKTWKYTYTVKPPTYTMPADGSSSVDCATQAVAPTAAVVYDNCGRLITVGTPTVQYDTACGGSVVYSFVYTGCDNQPKTWKYTYTVKPPTYTMPADGSSSVDCATQAVAPTAPVVYDNCGRLITVGTPTVQYDTACGGSVVYSFVYTGCDNQPKTWKYTYTVKPPTYTMPADGSSSVDCATQAVAPTAPVVYDNCGRLITVGTPTVQYDTACGGSVVYSFVYTGCDNQPKTWKYTYTVKPPTYTMPADGSSSVDCATQAVAPTAPVVYDNCGRLITVGTPTVQYDTACGGSVVYSFVYTGCDNQPKTWKYTYTVKPPTYTMPADGSSSVDCATQAVAPTAPVVYDNCGRLITVGTPTVQYDTACGGSVVYSFVYTGCDNQPKTWKYTYTVKPPTYTMPADGSSSVDCATQAVAPTAPVVYDNSFLMIPLPPRSVLYPYATLGRVVYSFVYTGCDNQPKTWKYTYTVKPPTYTMPADGSSSVDCATQAVAPTAPVVYDNCGRLITVGTPTVQYDTACGGS